jgi:hypothetical protein
MAQRILVSVDEHESNPDNDIALLPSLTIMARMVWCVDPPLPPPVRSSVLPHNHYQNR